MNWEDSQVECAWCGCEHISQEVQIEEKPTALCYDCAERHRKEQKGLAEISFTYKRRCF